jgi:hypothetical protein
VVGAVRVSVIFLTGLPQNLFGYAIDIVWLAAIGGEVGERGVLEIRAGAFFE